MKRGMRNRSERITRMHENMAKDTARLTAERDRVLIALTNIIQASDRFVTDTGLKHGDPLTDAVNAARPLLDKANNLNGR